MDFNNFDYLTINRLGYIHNYIQSVVPFVYDQSLDLFNLLKKLVDYANEIGKRNNDLASTFDNLVDYVNESEQKQVEFINKFVAQMRSEFEAWKTLYNQKYEQFTQEQINNYNNFVAKTEKALADFEENITNLFNQFKTDINTQEATFESTITNKQTQYETETTNQINAWKTEIDELIADIQSTVNSISQEYNTRYNNFESQTNNTLLQYNTDLTNLINQKSTDINNRITQAINDINESISETNLQPMVEEEVKTLIKSGEMSEALENLYGSIIRITYWDTNTPPENIESTIPVYHYNPDTATLTNCVTNTVVPILKNSIYIYNGYVYISEVVHNGMELVLNEDLSWNNEGGIYKVGKSIDDRYILFSTRVNCHNLYAYDTIENTFNLIANNFKPYDWVTLGQLCVVNETLTEIIFVKEVMPNNYVAYGNITNGSITSVNNTNVTAQCVTAIDGNVYYLHNRGIYETDFTGVKGITSDNIGNAIWTTSYQGANYGIDKYEGNFIIYSFKSGSNGALHIQNVGYYNVTGVNWSRFNFIERAGNIVIFYDESVQGDCTIGVFNLDTKTKLGNRTFGKSSQWYGIINNALRYITPNNGMVQYRDVANDLSPSGDNIITPYEYGNFSYIGMQNDVNFMIGLNTQIFFKDGEDSQSLNEIAYQRKEAE